MFGLLMGIPSGRRKVAVGLIAISMQLLMVPHGALGELIHAWPRHIIDLESYYQIANLEQAAQKLRQDAESLGHDIHQHRHTDQPAVLSHPLNLPTMKFSPDLDDHSYIARLEGMKGAAPADSRQAAILVVKRELTIDEVARLFESGIQIMQNLFAGPSTPPFAGLIVVGHPEKLLNLKAEDYFLWLGAYHQGLKMYPDNGASSLNRYTIFLFHRRIDATYLEVLEEHDVQVGYRSERFRTIGIECSWETARKLLELTWVRCIIPKEHPIDMQE